MLVEGHFLILYETHPNTDDGPVEAIEIVSIVDGRRDLTERLIPEILGRPRPYIRQPMPVVSA
jgi:hypothetical protein